MGRRTWESLPPKFRPLPGRLNVVVTSHEAPPGASSANSLAGALELVEEQEPSSDVWIIGGSRLFAEATHIATEAVVTEIDLVTEGDTFAPALDPVQWTVASASEQHASRTGLRLPLCDLHAHLTPARTRSGATAYRAPPLARARIGPCLTPGGASPVASRPTAWCCAGTRPPMRNRWLAWCSRAGTTSPSGCRGRAPSPSRRTTAPTSSRRSCANSTKAPTSRWRIPARDRRVRGQHRLPHAARQRRA